MFEWSITAQVFWTSTLKILTLWLLEIFSDNEPQQIQIHTKLDYIHLYQYKELCIPIGHPREYLHNISKSSKIMDS